MFKAKTIICIAGGSGVGKTTTSWWLRDNLLHEGFNVKVIVSNTTRPKRTNEIDTVDHIFATMHDWDIADEAHIVASTTYGGHKYWTMVDDFDADVCIYVIDEPGIKRLKQFFSDYKEAGFDVKIITVKLTCSPEELKRRNIAPERLARDPKLTLKYDITRRNHTRADNYILLAKLLNRLTWTKSCNTKTK